MRKGTVTAVTPLRVRRDGDTLPVPCVATDVSAVIGDEVLTETVENKVYIIVKIGGA